MDTETGKLLDDHIEWAKFTGATWQGDGFYYSAYDAPVKGKEFSNVNENHKIYYHKMGTPQSQDKLVYADLSYTRHCHVRRHSHTETGWFHPHSHWQYRNAWDMPDSGKPAYPAIAVYPSYDSKSSDSRSR